MTALHRLIVLLLTLARADGFVLPCGHVSASLQHPMRRRATAARRSASATPAAQINDKQAGYQTKIDIRECVVQAENLLEIQDCYENQMAATPALAPAPPGKSVRIKDESIFESAVADVAEVYLDWFITLVNFVKVMRTKVTARFEPEELSSPWLEASTAATIACQRLFFF